MADPGFPVGGGGGAPTSNVGAFQQKHMQKRKNWILLGGGGAGSAPWIRQCIANFSKYAYFATHIKMPFCIQMLANM